MWLAIPNTMVSVVFFVHMSGLTCDTNRLFFVRAGVLETTVGDESNRGISGGEAKRLSVAVEAIDLPGLLLLDEPTSGNSRRRTEREASGVCEFAETDRKGGVGCLCFALYIGRFMSPIHAVCLWPMLAPLHAVNERIFLSSPLPPMYMKGEGSVCD